MDDPLVARAVEHDRGGGIASIVGEEVLRAAQIAERFFADGGDEVYRMLRSQCVAVENLRESEHGGEPTRVVADARADQPVAVFPDAHVCPRRKYRVEMRADDDWCAAVAPRATADHVSNFVHPDVQAESAHDTCDLAAARFLRTRRGGDLRQRDLRSQNIVVGRNETLAVGRERVVDARRRQRGGGRGGRGSERHHVVIWRRSAVRASGRHRNG